MTIVVLCACGIMQAQDYSMVTGKSINDRITLGLGSCIRDGNNVTITFFGILRV
ncbi:MAG: hypothetical protein LBQ73_05235 [Tannerellaceae bacterium]|nr:hypothetical protein [Tannerellaceae bacterium]